MIHTLAIDSVELQFGSNSVIQGAYLEVKTGEIVGLLGRNGSGKTCLMSVIYGSLPCQFRTLKIDGVYTERAYTHKDLMRYSPQFSYIPNGLTLKKVFEQHRLDFNRFVSVFPEMEILYKQRVGHLSGGERRLAEVWLALAAPVKFALLDEPFSQIMPLHINRIKQVMIEEKRNKGIVITDHMYRYIMEVSDRVYMMANKSSYQIKKDEDLARLGYISWKKDASGHSELK